jgi:hypothetical protein
MTCRRVSAVSCFDARMMRNDLQALSVGPLISKPAVPQPVRRKPLNRTAGIFSFASIDLPSLLDARTLSLYATLLGLSKPPPVPRHDHGQEADSQADFQPVRREHEAGAGE